MLTTDDVLAQVRGILSAREGNANAPDSDFARIAQYWTLYLKDDLCSDCIISAEHDDPAQDSAGTGSAQRR